MTDTVIIREVLFSDIDAIMRIEQNSFLSGVQEDRELYLKRINTFPQGFLIAQDRLTGVVGGYICSELWHEDQAIDADVLALGHDPKALHHEQGKHLYITSFGVLPEWRGKRIGYKLFRALEEKMEQDFPFVTKKMLIVSEAWTAARNLYAKQGFKETGKIVNFFTPDNSPAQDAIIMMK